MAGINIDANLDGRNFIRGVGDMGEALEELQDSVTDVQKDGDKSLEKLEKSFAEVAKASNKAGDDIKKGIGKDTKTATKDASEGLTNMKEEALSTAKESAASFDGSAESIIGSFQEIAANAFTSFGIVGTTAGLAAAAGIGLISAAMVQAEADSVEAQQRVSELGTAMIEAGSDGQKPIEQVVDDLLQIVTNGTDAVKTFKDIQKEAEDLGLDANLLATAYAGGQEAIDAQADAFKKLIKEAEKQRDAEKEANGIATEASALRVNDLKAQQEELNKVTQETKDAAQAEQDWLASGGNELVAKAEMVSAVDQAYDSLAANVEYFTDKETGLFDTSAYITAMQEREQALKDYQETLTTSGLSPEAQEFLNSQGTEAASAMLQGYTKAGPDAKKELDRIWKEASKTASGSVKTELDGVVDKKRTAKIDATVDAAKAEEDLAKITKARTALIRVQYVDRNGKPVDS
jgi:hypothetical protein